MLPDACLAHLTARLHLAECGGYAERTIEVYSRKYHTLTFDTHHIARWEVGNEEHIFADELFWLVESSYTAEDCALGACTVVDCELQKFLALLHFFAVQNVSNTNVELLEIVERNIFLDRFCHIAGCFVRLFGVFELLELGVDSLVFNLLEQQVWCV